MARIFSVSAVRLLMILLILIAAYPSAAATSVFPESYSTTQSWSNSAGAASAAQDSWYYCNPWDFSWCYDYYWGYYWWYYPYYYSYYYPTDEVQTTRTVELRVETNPPGIAPVNGRGTYIQGSVVSFSLTSLIIPFGANQRYVFSYWSGDFSGAMPSGSLTMDSAKTVVANYELQCYLKVSVDPPGIVAAVRDGWYSSGESAAVAAVPQLVSGSQGVRYVFQHWTIDSVPVSGNSVEVVMDVPHTVVAHYKVQYLLTVSSEYGIVQGGGWYDAGSSATFSVTTPVETSYGTRQIFERWTGDSQSSSPTAVVTMDSPRTVRAVWRTDSTVLYATIALGIVGAFLLGIGLTTIAITRMHRAKPIPETPVKHIETVEAAPKKLKTAPKREKVKPPPKTESPESSPQA